MNKDRQNEYKKNISGTKTTDKVRLKLRRVDVSKIKDETKEKGWYIFVTAYFGLAKAGCQYLQKNRLTLDNKFITVAIVYNLKHGLETILKALQRTLNKGEIDKSDQIHNTNTLSKILKKKIKKDKNKKDLNKQINKLEKLICKYTEIPFLTDYLKNCFSINDYDNILLKYPENSAKFIVDYGSILKQINKNNIKDIEQDIDELIVIVKEIKKIVK